MSEHQNAQEGIADGDLEIQEPVVLDAALEQAIANFAIVAPEAHGFSHQMEGATYDESFAEFMGDLPSVVDPTTYAELVKSNIEISEEAQAEFEAVGDLVAQSALDAKNETLPEQTKKLAMASTVATNFASVGDDVPSEEVAPVSVAHERESLGFWDNHPKLQKAMLAAVSSLGLMTAQPASADNGYRELARAQVQSIGINFLAGIAQNALARQGVLVDPRGPVPIPGTQYPVYGGGELPVPPPVIHGGGYPPVGVGIPGGYESDSRLILKQQLIGQQQLLRRQKAEYDNYTIAEGTTYQKLQLDPANIQLRRDLINYRAARENQRITMEQTVEQIRLTQNKLAQTP